MAHEHTPAALRGIDPAAVHDEYERRGVAQWSDQALAGTAALVIAEPKVEPANSFVLHAPLELLARTGLLPYVAPEDRDAARRRIAWLAATYEAAGEPVALPAAGPGPASVAAAARALADALGAGDLDAVDRIAAWLGSNASPAELRRLLAAAVAPSLAAAGHASIFFFLHGRVAPRGDVTGRLLRGPARELARHPDWSLQWYRDSSAPVAHDASLLDALLAVPMLGVPGSDFIYPLMSQVQDNGVAAKLLAPTLTTPVDDARRVLQRVAAWSMLQEPGDYAKYGWSHCLTMPQAVMGLAGEAIPERSAVAIASTYVVGFRAALGQRSVEPVAPVLRRGEAEVADTVTRLAGNASRHHDAHLVKYTLACLDAAAFDPDGRDLYLDAAERLAQLWAEEPGDGFFD
jgi:hypothetical protein